METGHREGGAALRELAVLVIGARRNHMLSLGHVIVIPCEGETRSRRIVNIWENTCHIIP